MAVSSSTIFPAVNCFTWLQTMVSYVFHPSGQKSEPYTIPTRGREIINYYI